MSKRNNNLPDDDIAVAMKKYEGLPVPENPADVAALFALITKVYPNSLLHCSTFGSDVDTSGFTMTHVKLVEDLTEDARKHGCELKDVAKGVNLSEESIYLTMMTCLIYNICDSENYDPVGVMKAISKVVRDAANITRKPCAKFLSQM